MIENEEKPTWNKKKNVPKKKLWMRNQPIKVSSRNWHIQSKQPATARKDRKSNCSKPPPYYWFPYSLFCFCSINGFSIVLYTAHLTLNWTQYKQISKNFLVFLLSAVSTSCLCQSGWRAFWISALLTMKNYISSKMGFFFSVFFILWVCEKWFHGWPNDLYSWYRHLTWRFECSCCFVSKLIQFCLLSFCFIYSISYIRWSLLLLNGFPFSHFFY